MENSNRYNDLMKRLVLAFLLIPFLTLPLLSQGQALAVEVAPRISDREIIEGLANIRIEQAKIREEQAKIREEQAKIREEQANIRGDIKKLEAEVKGDIKEIRANINALQQQIADLKDSTNKQIADLKEFMLWGFGILFAGMFTLVGFVLWDRRTALSPAIRKNKELEEREDKVERVLKEYAFKEPRLAEILRSVGII